MEDCPVIRNHVSKKLYDVAKSLLHNIKWQVVEYEPHIQY